MSYCNVTADHSEVELTAQMLGLSIPTVIPMTSVSLTSSAATGIAGTRATANPIAAKPLPARVRTLVIG